MSGAMRVPTSRGPSPLAQVLPHDWLPGQDVRHRDPAKLRPLEEKRDGLVRRENLDRSILVGSRIGMDLDLAINQVDDPVHCHATSPVNKSHLAIFGEARAGHFDDKSNLGWLRMTLIIVAPGSARDDDVRLRNAVIIWDLEGLVATNVPA